MHQKGQECARQGLRHVVLRPEGIADPGSDGPVAELSEKSSDRSIARNPRPFRSLCVVRSPDRENSGPLACCMLHGRSVLLVFDLDEQAAAQLPLLSVAMQQRSAPGCGAG